MGKWEPTEVSIAPIMLLHSSLDSSVQKLTPNGYLGCTGWEPCHILNFFSLETKPCFSIYSVNAAKSTWCLTCSLVCKHVLCLPLAPAYETKHELVYQRIIPERLSWKFHSYSWSFASQLTVHFLGQFFSLWHCAPIYQPPEGVSSGAP